MSLAALGAACGDQQDPVGPAVTKADAPPSSAPVSPSTSGPTGAADRVAYFSTTARTTAGVHQVLQDKGELQRFAGKIAAADPGAAADIVAGGQDTDFSRRVLVGWTRTSGCSAATAARLTVSGSRLEMRVSQPKPPPECLAAFRMTVVFDVPKERIPARPEFG